MLDAYRGSMINAVRSEGEQRALFGAEDWVVDAETEIARLARSGAHFSADDIVAKVGPAPTVGAVGAMFRRAAQAGVIEPIRVPPPAASPGMGVSSGCGEAYMPRENAYVKAKRLLGEAD